MSSDLLLEMASQLLEREWRKRNCASEMPSHRMMRDLVDMMSEYPARPAAEMEVIIQRMLFENQFVDDSGDSMVLDACETIEWQAHAVVSVLEEVRRQALSLGFWSTEPATPITYG